MVEGFLMNYAMKTVARIQMTDAARALVETLKQQFGELLFHQSGGCCDGSQPMCFEKGDFIIGASDVCLGEIAGCEFWMAKDQFEYWQYTELTIDITVGRGSSFSLEIPMGYRFIVHSRMFTPEELEHLHTLKYGE
jgi:uncharacterized protein (DUF779 family)